MFHEQVHGFLFGVAVATLTMTSLPESGHAEEVRQVGPQPTNAEVANAIADSLRTSGLRGRDIEIEYARRNVILRGFMYDEPAIQRATRAALAVDPRMTVDNRLQVGVSRDRELVPELPAGKEPLSNQYVAQAVADEISIAGLRDYDIEVRYKHGSVRLSGRVSSQDEIDRATKAALSVEQVVRIESELVAAPIDPATASDTPVEIPESSAPANTPADANSARSAAEATRKRNAIILAMLVAGIALTGLLLVMAAIVARGFLRKMARQSEAKRRADLVLPPDVAAAAVESTAAGEVDESVPFSERETEVT